MADDPNQQGDSRRWIIAEVRELTAPTRTDYIDLYQIHRPDPETDIEETISALTDLIRSGKVRAIGDSACRRRTSSRRSGSPSGAARAFRSEQPPYSILDRRIEPRCCRSPNVTAWAPGLEPAGQGTAHRPHPQGAGDRPAPHQRSSAAARRAPPGRGGADHPVAEEAGLPMTHMAARSRSATPG